MRLAGYQVTALGLAVLAATAGCTRTSDGSLEMKRPSLSFGRLLSFGKDDDAAVVVPSKTLPPITSQPVPARLSANRAKPAAPKVSVPALKIAKNPPFKPAGKALTCRNTTTPTGRVKVVCT
jgi:hypothetical protein